MRGVRVAANPSAEGISSLTWSKLDGRRVEALTAGWNWVDWLIVIMLGLAAWRGMARGLIREVLDLVGAVAAIYLAVRFGSSTGQFLSNYFLVPPPAAGAAGFLLVLLAVGALAGFLASFLRKVIQLTPLSWADNLGGVAFGLLKSALVVMVLLSLLMAVPWPPLHGSILESALGPSFLKGANMVYNGLDRLLPGGAPRVLLSPEGVHLHPGPVPWPVFQAPDLPETGQSI